MVICLSDCPSNVVFGLPEETQMEMHLLVYVSYSNGFSVQFALDYDGSPTIGWGIFLVLTKKENNGSCGLVMNVGNINSVECCLLEILLFLILLSYINLFVNCTRFYLVDFNLTILSSEYQSQS